MEIRNDMQERSDLSLLRILQLSLLLSLSVMLQIIENMVTMPLFLPGIKLGLANIVIIIVLHVYGTKDALKVGAMKVLMAGILRNGLGISFIFSFMGTIISICAAGILRKYFKLSVRGIGIAGANFHIVGQIVAASLIYRIPFLYFSYLPYMLIITIFTGMLTGYLAEEVMRRAEFKRI